MLRKIVKGSLALSTQGYAPRPSQQDTREVSFCLIFLSFDVLTGDTPTAVIYTLIIANPGLQLEAARTDIERMCLG